MNDESITLFSNKPKYSIKNIYSPIVNCKSEYESIGLQLKMISLGYKTIQNSINAIIKLSEFNLILMAESGCLNIAGGVANENSLNELKKSYGTKIIFCGDDLELFELVCLYNIDSEGYKLYKKILNDKIMYIFCLDSRERQGINDDTWIMCDLEEAISWHKKTK